MNYNYMLLSPLAATVARPMDKIMDRVRATPAVAWARAHCPWVVATAVFWTKAQHIAPPGTHTEVPVGCWLAFTNPGTAHGVGGWTHVAFSLEPEVPHDDKRTAHLVKIFPPLVIERPCICKPLLPAPVDAHTHLRLLTRAHLRLAADLDFKVSAYHFLTVEHLLRFARDTARQPRGAWDLVTTQNRHFAKTLKGEFHSTRLSMRARGSMLKTRPIWPTNRGSKRLTGRGWPKPMAKSATVGCCLEADVAEASAALFST